jgi:hypothetical protein
MEEKMLQTTKRFGCPTTSGNDLNMTEMVNNDTQVTVQQMAKQLNMNIEIKIYFDQHD